ncbi:hypothetical protein ABIC83_002869 [Roseateles asaccharophilus]|uniref:hypothetical protein n=1 Tax=Roseateles asaccharophilus TaxID=582607 RepID=UPI0038335B37
MSLDDISGELNRHWAAFHHRTFNGTYWAIRRWRDASTTSRMGWELMMTRSLNPRRYGSELAAQRVADAANQNGGVPPLKPLSPAALEYLAGFGQSWMQPRGMRTWDKDTFVAGFLGVEFEDRHVRDEDARLVKVLRARGFFKRCFLEKNRHTRWYHAHLIFNESGAQAVYDALQKLDLLPMPEPEFDLDVE